MVRETRHLWVGNLPENIREERIRDHFKRYGRVQSVKLLSSRSSKKEHHIGSGIGGASYSFNAGGSGSASLVEGGLACTVAFMDIKSASKAHNVEHRIDNRTLTTQYYEPAALIPSNSNSTGSGSNSTSSSVSIGTASAANATNNIGASCQSPTPSNSSSYCVSSSVNSSTSGHGSGSVAVNPAANNSINTNLVGSSQQSSTGGGGGGGGGALSSTSITNTTTASNSVMGDHYAASVALSRASSVCCSPSSSTSSLCDPGAIGPGGAMSPRSLQLHLTAGTANTTNYSPSSSSHCGTPPSIPIGASAGASPRVYPTTNGHYSDERVPRIGNSAISSSLDRDICFYDRSSHSPSPSSRNNSPSHLFHQNHRTRSTLSMNSAGGTSCNPSFRSSPASSSPLRHHSPSSATCTVIDQNGHTFHRSHSHSYQHAGGNSAYSLGANNVKSRYHHQHRSSKLRSLNATPPPSTHSYSSYSKSTHLDGSTIVDIDSPASSPRLPSRYNMHADSCHALSPASSTSSTTLYDGTNGIVVSRRGTATITLSPGAAERVGSVAISNIHHSSHHSSRSHRSNNHNVSNMRYNRTTDSLSPLSSTLDAVKDSSTSSLSSNRHRRSHHHHHRHRHHRSKSHSEDHSHSPIVNLTATTPPPPLPPPQRTPLSSGYHNSQHSSHHHYHNDHRSSSNVHSSSRHSTNDKSICSGHEKSSSSMYKSKTSANEYSGSECGRRTACGELVRTNHQKSHIHRKKRRKRLKRSPGNSASGSPRTTRSTSNSSRSVSRSKSRSSSSSSSSTSSVSTVSSSSIISNNTSSCSHRRKTSCRNSYRRRAVPCSPPRKTPPPPRPPSPLTPPATTCTSATKPLAIRVSNLPPRSTDVSLKDGLFHEYKKHGKVTWVKVIGTQHENHRRYAIVCFQKPDDVPKSIAASAERLFFGCKLRVEPYHVSRQDLALLTDSSSDTQPYEECDLNEYHTMASRTLYIENLDKQHTCSTYLRKHFEEFGTILDIEIKAQDPNLSRSQITSTPHTRGSTYALCQFMDIASVVRAIRAMNGEQLDGGGSRLHLKFGKSSISDCAWLDWSYPSSDSNGTNSADKSNRSNGGSGSAAVSPPAITENYLRNLFEPFGTVKKVTLDRSRCQALVFYEDISNAQLAVTKMRSFVLDAFCATTDASSARRLQTDFASKECQIAFIDRVKKTNITNHIDAYDVEDQCEDDIIDIDSPSINGNIVPMEISPGYLSPALSPSPPCSPHRSCPSPPVTVIDRPIVNVSGSGTRVDPRSIRSTNLAAVCPTPVQKTPSINSQPPSLPRLNTSMTEPAIKHVQATVRNTTASFLPSSYSVGANTLNAPINTKLQRSGPKTPPLPPSPSLNETSSNLRSKISVNDGGTPRSGIDRFSSTTQRHHLHQINSGGDNNIKLCPTLSHNNRFNHQFVVDDCISSQSSKRSKLDHRQDAHIIHNTAYCHQQKLVANSPDVNGSHDAIRHQNQTCFPVRRLSSSSACSNSGGSIVNKVNPTQSSYTHVHSASVTPSRRTSVDSKIPTTPSNMPANYIPRGISCRRKTGGSDSSSSDHHPSRTPPIKSRRPSITHENETGDYDTFVLDYSDQVPPSPKTDCTAISDDNHTNPGTPLVDEGMDDGLDPPRFVALSQDSPAEPPDHLLDEPMKVRCSEHITETLESMDTREQLVTNEPRPVMPPRNRTVPLSMPLPPFALDAVTHRRLTISTKVVSASHGVDSFLCDKNATSRTTYGAFNKCSNAFENASSVINAISTAMLQPLLTRTTTTTAPDSSTFLSGNTSVTGGNCLSSNEALLNLAAGMVYQNSVQCDASTANAITAVALSNIMGPLLSGTATTKRRSSTSSSTNRRGSVQLSSSGVHGAPPASPPSRKSNLCSDSSDSGESAAIAASRSPTLEERIRSLDEKYERWSGSRMLTVQHHNSNEANLLNRLDTTRERFRVRHNLLDLDVKEVPPSDIVKSLMAKRSVFDEDLKRLENFSEKYEPKPINLFSPKTQTVAKQGVRKVESPTASPIKNKLVNENTSGSSAVTAEIQNSTNNLLLMAENASQVLKQTVSNSVSTTPSSGSSIPTTTTYVSVATTITVSTTTTTNITSTMTSKGVCSQVASLNVTPANSPRSHTNSTTSNSSLSSTSSVLKTLSYPYPTTHQQCASTSATGSSGVVYPTTISKSVVNNSSASTDIHTEQSKSLTSTCTTLSNDRSNVQNNADHTTSTSSTDISSTKLNNLISADASAKATSTEHDVLHSISDNKNTVEDTQSVFVTRKPSIKISEKTALKSRRESTGSSSSTSSSSSLATLSSSTAGHSQPSSRRSSIDNHQMGIRLEIDKDQSATPQLHSQLESLVDPSISLTDDKTFKAANNLSTNEVKSGNKCENNESLSSKSTAVISQHLTTDTKDTIENIAKNGTTASFSKHISTSSRHDIDIASTAEASYKNSGDHFTTTLVEGKPAKRRERNNSVPATINSSGIKRRLSQNERSHSDIGECKKFKLNTDSTHTKNNLVNSSHHHKRRSKDTRCSKDSSTSSRSERKHSSSAIKSEPTNSNSVLKNVQEPSSVGDGFLLSNSVDNQSKSHRNRNENKNAGNNGNKSQRSTTSNTKKIDDGKKTNKNKNVCELSPVHKSPVEDSSTTTNSMITVVDTLPTPTTPTSIPNDSKDQLAESQVEVKHNTNGRLRDEQLQKKMRMREHQRKLRKLTMSAATAEEQEQHERHLDGSNVSHSATADESGGGDSDEPRKHSIFDIVDDEPAYISMYDKVKARSCKNKQKQAQETRQKKLKDKFTQLKQSRAKREEKKRSMSWDEDDDGDDEAHDEADDCHSRTMDDANGESDIYSDHNYDSDAEHRRQLNRNSSSIFLRERVNALRSSLKAAPVVKKRLSKMRIESSDDDDDDDDREKVKVRALSVRDSKDVADDSDDDECFKPKRSTRTKLKSDSSGDEVKHANIRRTLKQLIQVNKKKNSCRRRSASSTDDTTAYKKFSRHRNKNKEPIYTSDDNETRPNIEQSNMVSTVEEQNHALPQPDNQARALHTKRNKKREKNTKISFDANTNTLEEVTDCADIGSKKLSADDKMENIFGSFSDDSLDSELDVPIKPNSMLINRRHHKRHHRHHHHHHHHHHRRHHRSHHKRQQDLSTATEPENSDADTNVIKRAKLSNNIRCDSPIVHIKQEKQEDDLEKEDLNGGKLEIKNQLLENQLHYMLSNVVDPFNTGAEDDKNDHDAYTSKEHIRKDYMDNSKSKEITISSLKTEPIDDESSMDCADLGKILEDNIMNHNEHEHLENVTSAVVTASLLAKSKRKKRKKNKDDRNKEKYRHHHHHHHHHRNYVTKRTECEKPISEDLQTVISVVTKTILSSGTRESLPTLTNDNISSTDDDTSNKQEHIKDTDLDQIFDGNDKKEICTTTEVAELCVKEHALAKDEARIDLSPEPVKPPDDLILQSRQLNSSKDKSNAPRAVISQEETEDAVAALLGESFATRKSSPPHLPDSLTGVEAENADIQVQLKLEEAAEIEAAASKLINEEHLEVHQPDIEEQEVMLEPDNCNPLMLVTPEQVEEERPMEMVTSEPEVKDASQKPLVLENQEELEREIQTIIENSELASSGTSVSKLPSSDINSSVMVNVNDEVISLTSEVDVDNKVTGQSNLLFEQDDLANSKPDTPLSEDGLQIDTDSDRESDPPDLPPESITIETIKTTELSSCPDVKENTSLLEPPILSPAIAINKAPLSPIRHDLTPEHKPLLLPTVIQLAPPTLPISSPMATVPHTTTIEAGKLPITQMVQQVLQPTQHLVSRESNITTLTTQSMSVFASNSSTSSVVGTKSHIFGQTTVLLKTSPSASHSPIPPIVSTPSCTITPLPLSFSTPSTHLNSNSIANVKSCVEAPTTLVTIEKIVTTSTVVPLHKDFSTMATIVKIDSTNPTVNVNLSTNENNFVKEIVSSPQRSSPLLCLANTPPPDPKPPSILRPDITLQPIHEHPPLCAPPPPTPPPSSPSPPPSTIISPVTTLSTTQFTSPPPSPIQTTPASPYLPPDDESYDSFTHHITTNTIEVIKVVENIKPSRRGGKTRGGRRGGRFHNASRGELKGQQTDAASNLPTTPRRTTRGQGARSATTLISSTDQKGPASDVYEFKDDASDSSSLNTTNSSSVTDRPRLVLTIKAPGGVLSASTTATTANIYATSNSSNTPASVPISRRVSTDEPQATRKSRRLLEKDGNKNNLDDTIEDVVKNNPMQTRSGRGRRASVGLASTTETSSNNTPTIACRKSPRIAQTLPITRLRKATSKSDEIEAKELTSLNKTVIESTSSALLSDDPDGSKISSVLPVTTGESAVKEIVKPLESLKAAVLRRVKGEISGKQEMATLIDPVTGLLTPMRECEEGRYSPLVDQQHKQQVGLPVTHNAISSQKAKPQSLKAHVLSSAAAQEIVQQHKQSKLQADQEAVAAVSLITTSATTTVTTGSVCLLSHQSTVPVQPLAPVLSPSQQQRLLHHTQPHQTVHVQHLSPHLPASGGGSTTCAPASSPTQPTPALLLNKSTAAAAAAAESAACAASASNSLSTPLNSMRLMTEQQTKEINPLNRAARFPSPNDAQSKNGNVSDQSAKTITKSTSPLHLPPPPSTPLTTNLLTTGYETSALGDGITQYTSTMFRQRTTITHEIPPAHNVHPAHTAQQYHPYLRQPLQAAHHRSTPPVACGTETIEPPQMSPPPLELRRSGPTKNATLSSGSHTAPVPLLSPQDCRRTDSPQPINMGCNKSLTGISSAPPHIARSHAFNRYYDHPGLINGTAINSSRTGNLSTLASGGPIHNMGTCTEPPPAHRLLVSHHGSLGTAVNVLSPSNSSNASAISTPPTPPLARPLTTTASTASSASSCSGPEQPQSMPEPRSPSSGQPPRTRTPSTVGTIAITVPPTTGFVTSQKEPNDPYNRQFIQHLLPRKEQQLQMNHNNLTNVVVGATGNLVSAMELYATNAEPVDPEHQALFRYQRSLDIAVHMETMFQVMDVIFKDHPPIWNGALALKNVLVPTQMCFVKGNKDLAKCGLPPNNMAINPLRIAQRMRLEPIQLEGLARKLQVENEHCLLLAMPAGRDVEEMIRGAQYMTRGFMLYLQEKSAAGIVNVPAPGTTQPPAYVVHIFPAGEFVNDYVEKVAPGLVKNIEFFAHLLIIITTV